MHRILRFVAVLLLALAIPVQGLAAIAAGQCMAFGHHQEAGSGDQAEAHEHDAADGHEQAAHSHDDGTGAQGDQGGKTSHCGPCAACCASASIAGPAGMTIASLQSKIKYGFWQFPPPGVEPDGFDRPPLAS